MTRDRAALRHRSEDRAQDADLRGRRAIALQPPPAPSSIRLYRHHRIWRRTAPRRPSSATWPKRIYERLRDEHAYVGGYTIVKDYVREQEQRAEEMFVPVIPGSRPSRLRRGGRR